MIIFFYMRAEPFWIIGYSSNEGTITTDKFNSKDRFKAGESLT